MLTVDPATRDFVDLTRSDRAGLAYLPGLDGLRGLAVAGVLAFHAGFEKMVGGYLGVSTFFTLSGFLITSLLLQESRRTGGVRLGRFWSRRFRRLLPASLAVLAAVMLLFGPFVATAGQRLTLKGDVLWSLFDVANWHYILQGSSYAQLFVSPSPVLHYWSLSIEEQFYVLFPLVLVGLWRVCRGRRLPLGLAIGGLATISFLEMVLLGFSKDRIYFGTDTRASELLLGGLLAVVLSSQELRKRLALRLRWRTAVLTLGAAALLVQLWWWWSLPQGTDWLYRGGFTLYAVMTCLVITAAAVPTGPVRWVLSLGALRWLGVRSYGIYLIHWPIFLTVRQTWPDLDRWLATVIAVSITMVLAVASFHLLETPIRTGRWPVRGRALPAAALSMAVVAALAFIPLPVRSDEQAIDFDQQMATYRQQSGRAGAPTSTTTTVVPTPPAPKVAWYGDSTALLGAMGFGDWGLRNGRAVSVEGEPILGCGVSRFVAIRAIENFSPTEFCRSWPERWGSRLDATKPDVAILMSSVWELGDARMPGASRFSALGDPATDAYVKNEFLQAVDVLSSRGALVELVTAPQIGSWAADGKPDAVRRQIDPARTARLNEILAQVAAERPDTVRLLDFASWYAPKVEDRSLRLDGIHIRVPQFEQVTEEWFGQAVLDQWDEWWRTYRSPATATTTVPTTTAPTTTTTTPRRR
ncbi:MAG: acyltransferase family protein [Microthrixaceae bacterium]